MIVAETFQQIAVVPNALTVAHSELDGSPVESLDKDLRFTATRNLLVAWADRGLLMAQLRGFWSVTEEGQPVWHRPHPYPDFAGVLCRDVKMKPLAAQVTDDERTEPSTRAEYRHCILTAQYMQGDEDKDDESDDDDQPRALFRERLEPRLDHFVLEANPLGWAGTSGIEPIDPITMPTFPLPSLTWVIERNAIPGLIADVYNGTESDPPGLLGGVNAAAVISPTLRFYRGTIDGFERAHVVFDPQTLLFEPPLLEREVTTAEVTLWKATFRFHYKPNGWNKFPKVTTDGTIEYRGMRLLLPPPAEAQEMLPYPPVSFNNILKLMFAYTGVPVNVNEPDA